MAQNADLDNVGDYNDLIATDLLPTASLSTDSKVIFEEPCSSYSTSVPKNFLGGRKRSVSQGITKQPVDTNQDSEFGIWYDSKIDSLLGSLSISNARERAESDFIISRHSNQSLKAEAPVTVSSSHIVPKEEDSKPKHPKAVYKRKKKKDDWTCLVCGNENYAWRHVCNMRKCRAPKPGHLLQQKPAGSWHCLQCGNLNYAERVVCNMRKCRAPRTTSLQGYLPNQNYGTETYMYPQPYSYEVQVPQENFPGFGGGIGSYPVQSNNVVPDYFKPNVR